MLDQIKKLREKTGAGVVDVKAALDEAKGSEEKAVEILRKKGMDKLRKKADRETREGVVASYVHSNKKIGSMVELLCETDFVAKSAEFQELAKDIVMHIAATNPQFLKPEDVDKSIIDKEKEICAEQLKSEKKADNIINKILEGKEKKFREEQALITQPFVKNPDVTVGELIAEEVGKIGENIKVGRFIRFEI